MATSDILVEKTLLAFDKRFGSNWQKSEQQFWTEFEKTLLVTEPAILPEKRRDT